VGNDRQVGCPTAITEVQVVTAVCAYPDGIARRASNLDAPTA
jgi:hypothetical protein